MTKVCPAAIACALRVALAFRLVVVAVHARQARAGGFVEGDAELHLRNGVDDGLVQILHGLDEMALAQDDVAVFRNFQSNRLEFHDFLYHYNRAWSWTTSASCRTGARPSNNCCASCRGRA